MKKWYNEEYQFEIEVKGFLRGDKTQDTAETERR